MGQARWWQRETSLLDYGALAQEEADEWERIAELVRAEGLAAYDEQAQSTRTLQRRSGRKHGGFAAPAR
ncbi:hypothetical protein [Kitasatospora sp. NBC_01302]|uniref:hypothetical protein n=1 Tax=Kitasatospora sp. NBC_01302 TaxID=2903575 RepID=UPI002E0F82E0|nr:hypothetical protein OG294_39660 [Kitasatospora sp. NBC_01302]